MSCLRVILVAMYWPLGSARAPLGPLSPDLFRLIDATSNAGELAVDAAVCAASRGAFIIPAPIGPAMTVAPTAASITLRHPVSVHPGSVLMMRSMRFLRSEPVTPETQKSADAA